MKKIFFTIIILLPFIAFSQRDLKWTDSTRLHVEKLRIMAFDIAGSADSSRVAVFTNRGFLVPSPYTYTKHQAFLDSIAAVRAAIPIAISGTYFPSNTILSNVDGVTMSTCQYMRVGNVVTVSGIASIDPTSASVTTEIRITLPIASNFSTSSQCAGTFSNGTVGGAISGNNSTDNAHFIFTNNTNTGADNFFFTFTYLIL